MQTEKKGERFQKVNLNLVSAALPGFSALSLACFKALFTSSSFSSGYDEQVEYTTVATCGTAQKNVFVVSTHGK